MRSTSLSDKKYGLHAVGGDYMVLSGVYDPAQYWLAFMERSIFRSIPVPAAALLSAKLQKSKPVVAPVENPTGVLYSYNFADRFQHVLPFREGKRVSNRQMNKMREHNFGTWERASSGELCTIIVKTNDSRAEIIEWCENTCKKRFHILKNTHLTFECSDDALFAKMRFS